MGVQISISAAVAFAWLLICFILNVATIANSGWTIGMGIFVNLEDERGDPPAVVIFKASLRSYQIMPPNFIDNLEESEAGDYNLFVGQDTSIYLLSGSLGDVPGEQASSFALLNNTAPDFFDKLHGVGTGAMICNVLCLLLAIAMLVAMGFELVRRLPAWVRGLVVCGAISCFVVELLGAIVYAAGLSEFNTTINNVAYSRGSGFALCVTTAVFFGLSTCLLGAAAVRLGPYFDTETKSLARDTPTPSKASSAAVPRRDSIESVAQAPVPPANLSSSDS